MFASYFSRGSCKRRVLPLLVLFGFALSVSCAVRTTLVGSPETDGMVIVLFDLMKWREDRTFKLDKDHYLRITGCDLQRLPDDDSAWTGYKAEQVITAERLDLQIGSFFNEQVTCFLFSDLKPGRYYLAASRAAYKASETFPETKHFAFSPEQYPQLVYRVPAGGVIYAGEIFFASEKGEITEVSSSKEEQDDVIKALIKADPEGKWAPALRARLAE